MFIFADVILFDVHRAVLCNIISRVKPARCSSVSNLFLFYLE